MKSVLINISFGLFPSLVFCQANSDAAKIKRERLHETRFYHNKTDSFPGEALYYDKEGRVRKVVKIDFYSAEPPPLRYINIEEFDSLGRKTKWIFSSVREKDLDEAKLVNDNSVIRTYFYFGDSVIIEIDSSWENKQFVNLQIVKTIIHWKKMTAPDPRPVLWQDSMESIFMKIRKNYKYFYSDPTSNVPLKIDSAESVLSVYYAVENNKLIDREHYESKDSAIIMKGNLEKVYTLNQKYDTVTWTSNLQENLPSERNIFGYCDLNNFGDYTFVRVMETKRIRNKYSIHTHDQSYGDWKLCEESITQDIKTKEPWNDYLVTQYFTDDEHDELEYGLKAAKDIFAAEWVEKIRY